METTMSQRTDAMLSKQDKGLGMSDTTYFQGMARETWPRERFGSVKASLNAMHRFISPRVRKEFTHRRARSILEGTARRIDAEEATAIRQGQIEEARREHQELKARLARLDAALAAVDPDFFGPEMEARRGAARPVGRVDLS
jgi:hypothetical protein